MLSLLRTEPRYGLRLSLSLSAVHVWHSRSRLANRTGKLQKSFASMREPFAGIGKILAGLIKASPAKVLKTRPARPQEAISEESLKKTHARRLESLVTAA